MATLDLTSLSPAEMIGECIMPRLNIEQFETNDAYRACILDLVRNHNAGGFCVFGGSPESVASTITRLQEHAAHSHGTPLFFSADCEFGLPMRFAGGIEFPDAMAIAQTGDPELAHATGKAIAREMRAIGLSWNFAPVADVNSNPRNPIINTRSFGNDPDTVIRFAIPFMEGLQSEGVAATAKHFPGHGDTSQDSHHELPFLDDAFERFQEIELPPFKALISAGVNSVMTGHLAAPILAKQFGSSSESERLPATLSNALTSNLLRKELGFNGVVVTDAMEMQAITNTFGEEEAIIRSLEAGTDILLMPPDPLVAFEAVSNALKGGRISESELRSCMLHIQRLKQFAKPSSADLSQLQKLSAEHLKLAKLIAERAIELTGNPDLVHSNLIVLTDDRPEATVKAKQFITGLESIFDFVTIHSIHDWKANSLTIDSRTVLATLHRARGYLGGEKTSVTMPEVIRTIAANATVLRGLILIGSPYLDQEFSTPPGFVLRTFSESKASIEAAQQRILKLAR
jgi:beta-N-acetylhexosaminidase